MYPYQFIYSSHLSTNHNNIELHFQIYCWCYINGWLLLWENSISINYITRYNGDLETFYTRIVSLVKVDEPSQENSVMTFETR